MALRIRVLVTSMLGMQLWLSIKGVKEEWKMHFAIEQHDEGRMVFELAQGAIDNLAFSVQPPPSYIGEMSARGFQTS